MTTQEERIRKLQILYGAKGFANEEEAWIEGVTSEASKEYWRSRVVTDADMLIKIEEILVPKNSFQLFSWSEICSAVLTEFKSKK